MHYPVWFRMEELAQWQAGKEFRTSVSSLVLWHDGYLTPHRMTAGFDRDNLIPDWQERNLQVNHPRQEDSLSSMVGSSCLS